MHRLVYATCIGFVAGIFFAFFMPLGWPLGIFALIISSIFVMFYKESFALAACVFFATFGFGVLRYEKKINAGFAIIPNGKIETQAVIIDEPVPSDTGNRLTLDVIATDNSEVSTTVMAVATVIGPTKYLYGDLLKIKGGIALVAQEKVPDYWKDYLELRGIKYQISFPTVFLIEHGHGNKIYSALYWLKNKTLEKIGVLWPEPESALAGGILIGARTTLGKDITDQFNKTGVSHIVALSGYNITMVAWLIGVACGFLPMTVGIILAAIAIILFVIMTGLSASAMRAVIMALILLLAKKEGRTYNAGTALLVAAFLMSLFNPLTPLHDFSFQLSFLAAAGIIWVSPFLTRALQKFPEYWKFKETFIGTISAMICVLPLIIYKTGIISLIALIANLLIVPLVPYIMASGAVATAVGFVNAPIAFPITTITYIMLYYVLHVVAFLASLPFAYITLAR